MSEPELMVIIIISIFVGMVIGWNVRRIKQEKNHVAIFPI
jgi:hypothetical protein